MAKPLSLIGTILMHESMWGKHNDATGILRVISFVCQMCLLWSGEDCTTSVKDFILENGTRAWVYTNDKKPSSPKNWTSLHRKNKQLGYALCNVFILYSKTTTKTTVLHCDSSWSSTVSTNKDQLLTTSTDSWVLEKS